MIISGCCNRFWRGSREIFDWQSFRAVRRPSQYRKYGI
jgi:hypothetical protein